MRHLTSKQKKLIEEYVKKNELNITHELISKLEAINDYETLYTDVKRYAEDYFMDNGGSTLKVLYPYQYYN